VFDLVGREVEVITVEAAYYGKLIEVTETEVLLLSESGWISVPVDRVASIREREE